jgi:hypothetical protein
LPFGGVLCSTICSAASLTIENFESEIARACQNFGGEIVIIWGMQTRENKRFFPITIVQNEMVSFSCSSALLSSFYSASYSF